MKLTRFKDDLDTPAYTAEFTQREARILYALLFGVDPTCLETRDQMAFAVMRAVVDREEIHPPYELKNGLEPSHKPRLVPR